MNKLAVIVAIKLRKIIFIMKKKIILYSLITLFSVFLFLHLNTINDKASGYDTSQQGISESKGEFIPEQETDFIFTTVEAEYQFNIEIAFVSLLLITAIIIIIVRKKKRTTKSDSKL